MAQLEKLLPLQRVTQQLTTPGTPVPGDLTALSPCAPACTQCTYSYAYT